MNSQPLGEQRSQPISAPAEILTADDALPSISVRHLYEVSTVERADIPGDGKGKDWYRYVLSSGRSVITGFHRGSLEEVQEYAAGCAEAFNLRNLTGKSSRANAAAAGKK
jgi:hypothetical protein